MSTSNTKSIISIVDAVNSLFSGLLTSLDNGHKVKLSKITEALQAEEFQKNLKDAVTEVVAKIKAPKGEKKLKDPDAPKKPLSGFLLFNKDKRPIVKKELPDLAPKEVMAELGKRWRDLSAKKKKPYMEASEKLKEEYKRLKEDYVRPSDEKLAELDVNKPKTRAKKGTKAKGAPKKKRDPNMPKGKKSAYLFYQSAVRKDVKAEFADEDGKADASEVRKEIAKRWKALSKEDKVEYEENALDDKERYEHEMKAYEAKKAKKSEDDEPEVEEPKPKAKAKTKKAKVEVSDDEETESDEEEKPKSKSKKPTRKIEASFDE